jgi:hypothetical protein
MDIDERFLAIYDGTVVNNADPEKLGRVRVRIPGLIEPESGWAEPVGKAGGSAQRGEFDVPEVGAFVTVQFLMGNPDRPKYQLGHWGKPGGKSEAPTYLANVSAKDAHLVRVVETRSFDIVMDSRTGKAQLILRFDPAGNGTLMRLKDKLIQLGDNATQWILLGTEYRKAENDLLEKIDQAIQALKAAAIGPVAGMQPGLAVIDMLLQAFKNLAAANNDWLSTLTKSE